MVSIGSLKVNRSNWDWNEIENNSFWCPDSKSVDIWSDYLNKIRKKGSLESETKVMVKRLVDKVEAKNDLLHRARIRVAKLEAERNVLKKKLEQYRSREAMIAEEAATEAERQVIALTKLRKQVEEDSEHMDNLNALQRSFDPDILVMTHKKKLMQEQQIKLLQFVIQHFRHQQEYNISTQGNQKFLPHVVPILHANPTNHPLQHLHLIVSYFYAVPYYYDTFLSKNFDDVYSYDHLLV